MTDDDALEAQIHYSQLLISNLKLQLCNAILLEKIRGKKRPCKPRSCFVRDWIIERPLHSHYDNLMKTLLDTYMPGYKYYLMIDNDLYRDTREAHTEDSQAGHKVLIQVPGTYYLP
ncbi:hypothetical protein Pcinc_008296 [Petrolisthes cinctipes]|uniref:Uncharacterized protein n=1 Tax=Petrolisthes cinctipes TaxID=88211 RepID=A0AAE1G7I2_PETCI|nr:hypothetical protein Pcinc_008296 [Petrolisthes cinctipes]